MDSDELKLIREKMRFTQDKMAERLGLSRPFYNSLETGMRHITKERALLIRAVFIRDKMGEVEGKRKLWELFERK